MARGSKTIKPPTHSWKAFLKTGNVKPTQGFALFSYGPAILGLRENVIPEGGVVDFVNSHPNLFATGTTSRDEGFFYWSLMQLLGPEGDEGGWLYQAGNPDANQAVVDFLIKRPGERDLGIRIQSQYRHLGAGPLKAATDAEQVYALEDTMDVLDVWSEWYIDDLTGRTVLAVARDAIAGDPFSISPILLGGQ